MSGLLSPFVVAIWTVPGFSTQDGPTHLYNAWILSRSFEPDSPYQFCFQVRWQPLPNWTGHLALAGLVRVVFPATADRIMITVTLAGFAFASSGCAGKSRRRSAAGRLPADREPGPNFLWLMGFTGFCSGVASCRSRWVSGGAAAMNSRRAAGRTRGTVRLGYFCHLVSLGLPRPGWRFWQSVHRHRTGRRLDGTV